jgi:hypothetical protein
MNAGADFKVGTRISSDEHYIRIGCDKNGRVSLAGS